VTTKSDDRAVWIKTTMTDDENGYVVTIEASDDRARILNPVEALVYAGGVLTAAARAAYDAAVLKQMVQKLELSLEAAAQVIVDLRKDRPPLDPAATYPLILESGATMAFKPFVKVLVEGQEQGQWSVEDAREHALRVLESVAVADLDSAYLREMIGTLGVSKSTASQCVEDLGNYR
jgi:hypothetical protein